MLGAETPSEEASEDEPEEISKDDLFHVLQNDRRRRVLAYLTHHADDGPFEMRTIAEQVAAWEHDTTVRQLMSDQRQRVYIALYQSHLPKLDEVGLIDYNQSRGIVDPTHLLDTVDQYVECPDAEDDAIGEEDATDTEQTAEFDQQYAFMGVTAVSLLLTAGVWFQSIPASLLSGTQAALIITALFALTAMVPGWVQSELA